MDTRLFPSDTLLVVVDVQERLLPAMDAGAAAALVRNVCTLIHAAAAVKAPVVVTEQYPKGLGDTVPELAEAIDMPPNSPVSAPVCCVEKCSFSCR